MQAKHSHLGLWILNLKELEVGKILQYDAKKEKNSELIDPSLLKIC